LPPVKGAEGPRGGGAEGQRPRGQRPRGGGARPSKGEGKK